MKVVGTCSVAIVIRAGGTFAVKVDDVIATALRVEATLVFVVAVVIVIVSLATARLLLAALASPLFVAAALMSAPMWGLSEWLCHKKVKDPAFRNTARFGVKLIGTILFGIIWAAVLFSLLPWWAAAAGLLYFFMSYSIFYDWLNLIRR